MRPFFMSYVQGEDRGQAALLPHPPAIPDGEGNKGYRSALQM
jgi:hypothetical protein